MTNSSTALAPGSNQGFSQRWRHVSSIILAWKTTTKIHGTSVKSALMLLGLWCHYFLDNHIKKRNWRLLSPASRWWCYIK